MGQTNGTGKSLREQILATREALKTKKLDVPGWSFPIWIRELTALERGDYEASLATISQKLGESASIDFHAHHARIKLCALSIVDEDGRRIFTSALHEENLGHCRAADIQFIHDEAAKLNGMAKEEVEDAGKGSDEIQPAAFSSDSPSE